MTHVIDLTENQRRLLPVAMVVIGLHAALLSIPVRSVGSGSAVSLAHPLSVRMLTAPIVDAAVQTLPPSPPVTTDAAAQHPARPRSVPEVAPAPTPPEKAPATATATTPDASPPLPSFGLVVPGIDSDDDYYARSMLTLAPRPLDPVVIDYPTIDNDQRHYRSELTLFIDETGRVVRVRVDGASLPPALEAAARSAFINAQFRAGEADGRAVKSRIRVEVEFDNRPLGSLQ